MLLDWIRTRVQPPENKPETLVLNMAKEFTPMPMGIDRDDGPKSGEAFREDLLKPRLAEAIRDGKKLEVDFEGMLGLSSSFLEEVFGGLVRNGDYSADELLDALILVPDDFSYFFYAIREYIRDARKQ